MKKLTLILAVLALGAFAVSACGDDDDDDVTTPVETVPEEVEEEAEDVAPGGGETVSVSAEPDGSLAFQEDNLRVPAGEVTFEFDNPAQLVHDFCVEDQQGNEVGCTDTITADEDSLTVDLEPGKYEFYCSVAGHREGGMEGPLTVK